MKKTAVIVLCSILLSSCQRGCQEFKRENITTKRDYSIEIFSGGKVIFRDSIHGIVNEEDGNGCFYYKGDTLIEISGDYILKSIK